MPLRLVRPAREHLACYRDALERGFSPDNTAPERTRLAQLAAIAEDADAFLAAQENLAPTDAIELPDGSRAPRLPGFRRWAWQEGAFLGSVGLRFQRGTPALPPHVLGHIGYAVVPWGRGRGVATRALALMLAEARGFGLPWVELTTDPENPASARVIEKNGGVLVERFEKPGAYGGGAGLRWRIALYPD